MRISGFSVSMGMHTNGRYTSDQGHYDHVGEVP